MTVLPTIPNADRVVDYSPVSPTTGFVVPWPVVADSEIAACDDLAVMVDGDELASSEFGFSGNVIAGVNGMWNGGTVTLDEAVSGVRVVIFSRRAPRRTGQFLEGKALKMTTLDQLMDDIVIQLRDLDLSVARAFKSTVPNFLDDDETEVSFSAGTLEAVVGAFLAGISPATAVAGWALTLSAAKALYPAPVVLAGGHTVSVTSRAAAGDGYGGIFAYDASDSSSTFAQDGLGFVDNQGRRFKRVYPGQIAFASWFGAKGDDSTDDLTALQAAITTCRRVVLSPSSYYFQGTLVVPANTTIEGCGPASCLRQKNGNNVPHFTIDANNVTIRDLSITGYGFGIKIGSSSAADRPTIQRVNFLPVVAGSLDGCVWLHTATNITVDHCSFVSPIYGVLFAEGYNTAHIWISNCDFSNTYADAIEQNSVAGTCAELHITKCTFNSSHGFGGAPQTENRFLGLTSARRVRVRDCYINNAAGDAPIHIEGTADDVIIDGCELYDCTTSGGNDGWVYVLCDGRVVVRNTKFEKTVGSSGSGMYALSTSSGSYSGTIEFVNNVVIEGGSAHSFSGLNFSGHQGNALIEGNHAKNLSVFADVTGAASKQFRGNKVEACLSGIITNTGSTGNGGSNIEISDNSIETSSLAVFSNTNSSGTNRPTNWEMKGNSFFGAGIFRIDDGLNCVNMGNTFPAGIAYRTVNSDVLLTATNCVDKWNTLRDTGLVDT